MPTKKAKPEDVNNDDPSTTKVEPDDDALVGVVAPDGSGTTKEY